MRYDKFQGLPGPIADANRAWEAAAIEQCRNDPRVKELGLCYVCMCHLPICHCVDECRFCAKPFGQYACQCPGQFQSAFNRDTGERLHPPPTGAELQAIEAAEHLLKSRRDFSRDKDRSYNVWVNRDDNRPLIARAYRNTRLHTLFEDEYAKHPEWNKPIRTSEQPPPWDLPAWGAFALAIAIAVVVISLLAR